MFRIDRVSLVLAALGLIAGSAALAQGFETGRTYIGPRLWFGNLNGAVAFGVQGERGVTQPGEAGPGIISAGVGLDWYSWSYDYAFGSYDYSVVPIQGFGNYHFLVKSEPRIDPYAGLALVYQIVSASWDGAGTAAGDASDSTFDIAAHAGARYFVTPSFAVQAQVGFGYGTIALGATWKF